MKSEHRLERNRLKGQTSDATNTLLSAAAVNFSKLVAWMRRFLAFLHARGAFSPCVGHVS
jgi:IS5 family transposase